MFLNLKMTAVSRSVSSRGESLVRSLSLSLRQSSVAPDLYTRLNQKYSTEGNFSSNTLEKELKEYFVTTFKIPQSGPVYVGAETYTKTFSTLYAHIGKLQNAQNEETVLRVLDACVNVGTFDHAKNKVSISRENLYAKPSPFTNLPPVVVKTFHDERVLSVLENTVLSSNGISIASLERPTDEEKRVFGFFQKAVMVLGKDTEAIEALCVARVRATPDLGVKVLFQLWERRLPASRVKSTFESLNTIFAHTVSGSGNTTLVDTLKQKDSDLLGVLRFLATFSVRANVNGSSLHAAFVDSFLHGSQEPIITALMSHLAPASARGCSLDRGPDPDERSLSPTSIVDGAADSSSSAVSEVVPFGAAGRSSEDQTETAEAGELSPLLLSEDSSDVAVGVSRRPARASISMSDAADTSATSDQSAISDISDSDDDSERAPLLSRREGSEPVHEDGSDFDDAMLGLSDNDDAPLLGSEPVSYNRCFPPGMCTVS